MSLSQPFVHKGYVGGKLHFDFTDWIGLRGVFAYGVLDFDDATWECQIRRTVPGPTVGTPELVDSNVETVDGDPGTTTVQLTFKVDDTTVFGDKVTYYFGVRAVGGATPRTLIVASPIVGRTPIAH